MKPLELSCITGVWKTALGILDENMAGIGSDLTEASHYCSPGHI